MEARLKRLMVVPNCSGEPEILAVDMGAIVELLPPDGLEVGFLRRDDGRTRHIGTLSTGDGLVAPPR